MKVLSTVALCLLLAGSATAQDEAGIFPFDYRLVEYALTLPARSLND